MVLHLICNVSPSIIILSCLERNCWKDKILLPTDTYWWEIKKRNFRYSLFTIHYSPSGTFISSRLRFLLIRNWFVEMRMGKRPEEWKRSELLAHEENINKRTKFVLIQNYFPHASLLLSNGLLSVPALEENLFWVGVEKTNLGFIFLSDYKRYESLHHPPFRSLWPLLLLQCRAPAGWGSGTRSRGGTCY